MTIAMLLSLTFEYNLQLHTPTFPMWTFQEML